MNKSLFCLIFFLFIFSALWAENSTTLEFRAAVFFPSSHRLRDIYANTGASYQLEARTALYFCSRFETWANLDYFSHHGHIKNCCDGRSRLDIYNISLGINYIFQFFHCYDIYLGIGPSLARVDLKNDSCCLHQTERKLTIGGVLKTGLRYHLSNSVFFDLFADYLYQPINYHHKINIGGLKTGAGIGIKF